MNQPCDPSSVIKKYILILDFRDDDGAIIQWNAIRMICEYSSVGGLLLRGGRPDQWLGIRGWFEQRDLHPLIFADFEQGAASQLTDFKWLPSAFSLGAMNSTDMALRVGSLIGRQARLLKIDGVFAPVADLLLNTDSTVMGPRCFGTTPQRVADLCTAFINGCREQRIMTVAKHFPGHGRSSEDSHIAPVIIRNSYEEWEESDYIPFRESIRAGCDGIMVGHIWFEGLDPFINRPASLSPVLLNDILRKKSGFHKYIFTDSLDMKSVSPGDQSVADKALRAGADYIVGVQDVLRPATGVNRYEPPPKVPADGIQAQIDVLNRESGEICREVARRSIAWVQGYPCYLSDDDTSLLYVCTDATPATWADTFVSHVSSRIPGIRIQKGSASELQRFHGISLILIIGRPVKPRSLHTVTFVIMNRCFDHILCVNFGATWLLSQIPDIPILLAGDALAETQVTAASLLLNNDRTTGDPDL